MIKIESLKDYINVVPEEDFFDLATRIYKITDFICEDYPNHKNWYYTKQLPAIVGNERNILFARSPKNENDIIAMACLKKDKDEQKICTLYVSDKCRGLGLGTTIIESSMEWLETTKPLITLADYKLKMFEPVIKKYNWELAEIVSGLYNERSKELCFNGTLTKVSEANELHKRLINVLQHRVNTIK